MLACFSSKAQSSVLATGKWYKMAIDKNGVYRIDQSLFRKMGFTPGNTDPRKIKIYSQPGGMLPQRNSAPRPVDLIENAIFIQGEADGIFNSQDYILFYGEGPDRVRYDETKNIFAYEKNLYAKSNFYFITVSDSPGKRIASADSPGSNFPVIREFDNYVYHELDQYNELKSGREWFGERFDLTTELTVRFDLANVVENSSIKFVSDVMAQSFGNSSFTVYLNGLQIGSQTITPIPNAQYGIKGRHAVDTFQTNATVVSAVGRTTQDIKYQYTKSASGRSVGYLNYCLLQVKQQLRLYGNQIAFRSISSLQNPQSTFELSQSTAQVAVWDITNSFEPVIQSTSFTSGITKFSPHTNTLKTFIAFLPSAPAPKLIGAVQNQNLHGLPSPNLIIVTHPAFKDEAKRLKAHRESFNNLQVLVVTTDEIYHEFSGGKQDVTAIRDMARHFYSKNAGSLKSLLLFGKGSYDYKDILVDNKNFVPTYQSRNSLHPLQTYSSDDFFGFMEDTEGEWNENPVEHHTMDIGVGRLPVKNLTEAKNVVDKIIRYDTDPKLSSSWRKNIYFVADDGDFNIHQNQADLMARNIDQNFTMFNTRKIYLDAFPQIPGAGGEVSPETRSQIEKAFNDGALIINYTGHGAERVWAQERIFDEVLIQKLKNERLPLLVTATCEFGRQDDPLFPSGGELCMTQASGGAIGLVTTSRPVSSSTNFDLNQAFYQALFQKDNGKNLSLGEIFKRTKNTSISGVSNRNFSLIGDPSLHLALPEYAIQVTYISTADESDLLKALSHVTVKGNITDFFGEQITNFNGTLEATLFDKETSFITLGNENPPFAYKQWFNALFRGQSSVKDGIFEFQFVMPKNISYAIDVGKLSLFASRDGEFSDASGYSTNFTIGSSEENVPMDNIPPIIDLYMEDTSFENGGVTGPNPRLLAFLSDNNGINISGYGIGNSIVAVIDDDELITLNDYYTTVPDDYTKGIIDYRLNGLSLGKHSITLRAWDTHNNSAQATVDFSVTESNGLVINEFSNYPNPFKESTQLYFTHNQAGNDLEAILDLVDYTGKTIISYELTIPGSAYQVDLIEFSRNNDDFLKKLPPGLYLARLVVRSLADGSKNERVTKLILLN
jgi:hypothetical protein